MEFSATSVEAAVAALYSGNGQTEEANAYLSAFQASDDSACWDVAICLLRSPRQEVSLFAACCLSQKAKCATLPPAALQHHCEQLLIIVGSGVSPPVRSQLCLATAALGGSLEAGPAAIAQSPTFTALPADAQVEVLAALPQACPQHHESLRGALSHVMALLQHHTRADAPAELAVASCVRAWLPLGLDLPDLSASSLLGALVLGLRYAEPLCEVCAEVLVTAMGVSSYPTSSSQQPLLRALLQQLVLGAQSFLPPHAADGASMAAGRVLAAAICAAPETAGEDGAAVVQAGGWGGSPVELLLQLSALEDVRVLEEVAPAWAELAVTLPAESARSTWQQLLEALLRQSAYPDEAGGGNTRRVIDWDGLADHVHESKADQGDFARLRRCASRAPPPRGYPLCRALSHA